MIKELTARREKFCAAMNGIYPEWDTAVIISKVNQYYFTGTIQNALLLIKKGGSYSFNVRQSYERALAESPLPDIHSMKSYKDVAAREGKDLGNTFIETDSLPYSVVMRLLNSFNVASVNPVDRIIRNVRAVKSAYELGRMEESGRLHNRFFAEIVPCLLREGMSEAELHALLQGQLPVMGHQILVRYHDYLTEDIFGRVGFGTNLLYASNSDTAVGGIGMSPAVPQIGSTGRKLQKGDLVLVDICFGVDGYHTDKTQIYSFGTPPSVEAVKAQQQCMDVAQLVSEAFKPGAIPSQIYLDALNSVAAEYRPYFMKHGDHQAGFIGHGIGLHVDEMPVIAKGFDDPLQENMTIAVEPKIGLPGFGVVGVEDTWVITPEGGRCLTGGCQQIIAI